MDRIRRPTAGEAFNTTIPLYCRLVDFNSTSVLMYAAQFPGLPGYGFEMDVKLIGRQVTAEPLVRKGTLVMHQLTPKNQDPQVERTVWVGRPRMAVAFVLFMLGRAGVRVIGRSPGPTWSRTPPRGT